MITKATENNRKKKCGEEGRWVQDDDKNVQVCKWTTDDGCTMSNEFSCSESESESESDSSGSDSDDSDWFVINNKGKPITCAQVARNPARRCNILKGAVKYCAATCKNYS